MLFRSPFHGLLRTIEFAAMKRVGVLRIVQRRRTRQMLRRARAIAFVCYGNICRSPFAAAMARQLRPDLTVTSIVFTQSGAPLPKPASPTPTPGASPAASGSAAAAPAPAGAPSH